MPRRTLGLLIAALLGLPARAAAQPAPGDVVVNEILYAPTPSTNEYIELYNRSDTLVPLDELSFADDNRSYVPVTAADTSLAPGAYAVLVRSPDAFAAAFPSVPVLVPTDWPALNNGGDTVLLRHAPTRTRLDSVPYVPAWGGSNGRSLERIDPAGPSDQARNFASTTAEAGGTPGARNSAYAPDETPPDLGPVTPSPSGDSLTVRFSEPVAAATVVPGAFSLVPEEAPAIAAAVLAADTPQVVHCILDAPLNDGSYTLVVDGVADRRGNAVASAEATFQFFVPVAPAPQDVVISELWYAPPATGAEFVELYNRSDVTVDLGALQLADANRAFVPVSPPLTPLAPGEYAVVVDDAAVFASLFPGRDVFSAEPWAALNNGGDTVFLRHAPSSALIDSVPYAPAWGGSDGRSLERIDPRGPSAHPSNFAASTAPAGATPGAQNSRFARDTRPPRPTFVEQTDSLAVGVVFNEPVQPASVRPEHFSLGEAEVTQAALRADSVAHLSLSRPPSRPTLTVQGVTDLAGNRAATASHAVAHRPSPGALIINEILFAPRADDFDERPNQVEYVELYNRARVPLTLNGLLLTDRPTEADVADTLRVGRRRAVAPGGYAVVAAAPTDARAVQQSQLAAAFPNAPLHPDSVAYLPYGGASLGLRNDGDRVRLHRRDRTPVATVDYHPDWHAPSLAAPTGTALERISRTSAASAPDNWSSSPAADGGTPGAPNALALAPPPEAPAAGGLRIRPNPFSIERDGATRIQFSLPKAPGLVRVRVYDARGRLVRTLESARLVGPSGELVWNGRDETGKRVRIGPYVVLFEAVRPDGGTSTQLKETVIVARPLR